MSSNYRQHGTEEEKANEALVLVSFNFYVTYDVTLFTGVFALTALFSVYTENVQMSAVQ